jgi:hypothetical protein
MILSNFRVAKLNSPCNRYLVIQGTSKITLSALASQVKASCRKAFASWDR